MIRRAIAIASLLGIGACASAPPPDSREAVSGPPPEVEAVLPPSAPLAPGYEPPGELARGPTAGAAGRREVAGADLDRLLEAGPGWLLGHVQLSPVRRAGRFVGFGVERLSPEAERALAGALKPGDVIVGLMGSAVRTPDDLMAAIERARAAEIVRLDLERAGEESHVDWVVRR